MKTPLLLNVPKDRPSRKERINEFKKLHNIVTLKSSLPRKDEPWFACLMTSARKFGYGVTEQSDLFDCVAKVGRLMEESGVLVTGETEADAIRTLCENNKIPCDL